MYNDDVYMKDEDFYYNINLTDRINYSLSTPIVHGKWIWDNDNKIISINNNIPYATVLFEIDQRLSRESFFWLAILIVVVLVSTKSFRWDKSRVYSRPK